MPVHEVHIFFASCDECGWVTEDQNSESEAEALLDRHIRSYH
jgi:hypothetical protein